MQEPVRIAGALWDRNCLLGLQEAGRLHEVLIRAGYNPDQCNASEEQNAQNVALFEQLSDVVIEELPVNKAMQELCVKAAKLKEEFDAHRLNDEQSIHHDSSEHSAENPYPGMPPPVTYGPDQEADVAREIREGTYA